MRMNKKVLKEYTVESARRKLKCVANPDGTHYATHALTADQWEALPFLHALLEPFREATTLFQTANVVTVSLVIPVISSLYLRCAQRAKWVDPMTDNELEITGMDPNEVESVLDARLTIGMDMQTRFFENLDISKVEDYALATALDPCFKDLDIPGLSLWDNGNLTKDRIWGWLRGAWEDPAKGWKPVEPESGEEPPREFVSASRRRSGSLLAFTHVQRVDSPMARCSGKTPQVDLCKYMCGVLALSKNMAYLCLQLA